MANWKALAWSETVKTGKPQARAVLTMLCLKATDDGKVWSDAARIARLCELSPRRLYDWRDYLAEHGFVTVIRRVRPNGSEAKPATLINYPDAPHLNGAPVRLDYDGKYLYPRDPDALRAAGITWISAETTEQLHPAHRQTDSSSGCQADELSGCVTGGNRNDQQVRQADELSGWQPDDLSAPGDDKSSAPKQFPFQRNPQPTTAAAISASPGDGGWLDDASQQREAVAGGDQESSGACLLRSLRLPGQAAPLSEKAVTQWAATVDRALAGFYSPVALVERLTNGLGDARNPAGVVVSRLGELRTEHQQPQRATTTDGVPAWCGECGSHWPDERAKKNPRFRTVLADDGETERLCTCHPRHPDRQPVVAA